MSEIDYKRIRELCARVLQADGPAFREAVLELAAALESVDVKDNKSTGVKSETNN